MGGNTANLLQDIRASKNKLTLTSQTVTQAHSSFTTQSTELMTLIEQLESKFQELEKREGAVVKEENAVKDKTQLLQREQKCIEREQKLDARERAVAEKETKWTETDKKMQQNAAKIPNYVQLSISGTKFTVAKEKLIRYKGSLFEQVIVSDHPPLTPTGELFFERDPSYFRYIIRFLLDGDFKIPSSAEKQAIIKKEFGYYNIPCKIADLLHLDDKTSVSAKIKEWLPEKKFKLIYKASVDGYGAADFRKWCDNKGPTLTVIRSTNGYLFGGYSSVSWDSINSYKTCADAFIFTLINPHNIPPTKYTCQSPSNAIYNFAAYGPSFGKGNDICICHNSHQQNNNYINFPTAYTDTTGKGRETFTGTRYFTVQEIEIFSVY